MKAIAVIPWIIQCFAGFSASFQSVLEKD